MAWTLGYLDVKGMEESPTSPVIADIEKTRKRMIETPQLPLRAVSFAIKFFNAWIYPMSAMSAISKPRLLFDSRLAIVQRVKKLLSVAALVLIAAVAAHAANLTGTWNAKVDLGGQGGTPTFVLKQDGEKLTGTYSGALGEAPVTGSIKGSAVVFDFEASGAKVHYEGKLNAEGTTIEGSVDYGGQASGTFTATKQAEKK